MYVAIDFLGKHMQQFLIQILVSKHRTENFQKQKWMTMNTPNFMPTSSIKYDSIKQ